MFLNINQFNKDFGGMSSNITGGEIKPRSNQKGLPLTPINSYTGLPTGWKNNIDETVRQYNNVGDINYTDREKDIMRQVKEQGGTDDEMKQVVEEFRVENSIEVMPSKSTRGEITKAKTDNKGFLQSFKQGMDNLVGGSLIGSTLDTGGLLASGVELQKSIKEKAVSELYKYLPDNVKEQISPYIPDEIKTGQVFSDLGQGLDTFGNIKEQTYKGLGIEGEATTTKVGEFVDPFLATSIATGLPKVIKSASLGLKNKFKTAYEWGLKNVGKLSQDKDALNLILDNPELALKELGGEVEVSKVIDKLEEIVKKDETLKTEYNKLKQLILPKQQAKEEALLSTVEGAKTKYSEGLDKLANLAETNINKSTEELAGIGQYYDNFKGLQSNIEGGDLSNNFYKTITSENKYLSDSKRTALDKVINEINLVTDDAVSINKGGNLTYDQLQAIRQNIDGLIDWKTLTKETNNFLKEVRNRFDDVIKNEFPSSKELDIQYKEARDFRDTIKETFGKDGVESDSFRNQIKTLSNPENKKKLERYSKLLGISEDNLIAYSKSLEEAKKVGSTKIKDAVDVLKLEDKEVEKLAKDYIGELGVKQQLDKITELSKTSPQMNALKQAIELDIQAGDEIGTRFITGLNKIFDTMASKTASTSSKNEAEIIVNKLSGLLGTDKMKQLEVANAIEKVLSKASSETSSLYSLAANTMVANKIAPGAGFFFLKYRTNPKAALEELIKSDKSHKLNKETLRLLQKGQQISKTQLGELINFLEDNFGKVATFSATKSISNNLSTDDNME